jgi:uncharacterized membrane protein YdbT with pleckstrin-like domain
MSSVTENLLQGEEVVQRAEKHWFALVRASLVAAGLVVLAGIVTVLLPAGGGVLDFVWTILGWLRTIAVIVGVAWIVYNVIEWRTAEFAVTNVRVLRYEGLLRKRASETLLSAVTDVKLNVSFVGKQLGFGDLKIFTQSGEAGADTFNTITDAAAFRNAMMNIKIGDQQASRAAQAAVTAASTPAPAPAPAPAEDPTVALSRLAELRDQGIITPEEFEAKKTEILARI